MGRRDWSWEDSDEARLPEGMRRVGYDADTQTYTYRDQDGSYWEGGQGVRYGVLQRSGTSYQPVIIDKEQAARKDNSEVWQSVTSSLNLFLSSLLEKAEKGKELGKEKITEGLKGLGTAGNGTENEKASSPRNGKEKRGKGRKGRARTPREGMERRGRDRKIGKGY